MNEYISSCCGAGLQGELSNSPCSGTLEGRCADCKEMSNFVGVIEVQYDESINYEIMVGV